MIDSYYIRKEQRRKAYMANHGRKMIICIACSGSGYYDTTIQGRIPYCNSCNGTGKEREVISENYRRV